MGLIFSDCHRVCMQSDPEQQQQHSVTQQSSISCSYPSFHQFKTPENRRSFKTNTNDFSSLFMYMIEDDELQQFELVSKQSDGSFFFMFKLSIKNYQNYQSYMFYQCPTFVGLDSAFNVFKWEDLIGISFKLTSSHDQEFFKFMDPLNQLRMLKLSVCDISRQMFSYICKKIKEQQSLMSLELNLANCKLNIDPLGDTLLHKVKLENLALKLKNIQLGELFLLDLQTSLKQMSYLKAIRLNVSQSEIKSKSVIRMFHLLSEEIKCIKLNLSHNKSIDDENIEMVKRFWTNLKMMNLLPNTLTKFAINLSYTLITQKSFGVILKKLVGLKSLKEVEVEIRMNSRDGKDIGLKKTVINQFVSKLSECNNRRSMTQMMSSTETFYLMDQLKMSTDFSSLSHFTFKTQNLVVLPKEFLDELSVVIGPQLKYLDLEVLHSEKLKDTDKLIRILGQAVNLRTLKLKLPCYTGLSERMRKLGIVEFHCSGGSELIGSWDHLVKVHIKNDKGVLKQLFTKQYLLYYQIDKNSPVLDKICLARKRLLYSIKSLQNLNVFGPDMKAIIQYLV